MREVRYQSTNPDREINRITQRSFRIARQIRRDAYQRDNPVGDEEGRANTFVLYAPGGWPIERILEFRRLMDQIREAEQLRGVTEDGYVGDDEGEEEGMPSSVNVPPLFIPRLLANVEGALLRVLVWRQRGLMQLGGLIRRAWTVIPRPTPSPPAFPTVVIVKQDEVANAEVAAISSLPNVEDKAVETNRVENRLLSILASLSPPPPSHTPSHM